MSIPFWIIADTPRLIQKENCCAVGIINLKFIDYSGLLEQFAG